MAVYRKTCCFCCILISPFWNAEILLHFNFAFSQSSTGIYQGQSEFSRVFKFEILSCLRKFHAHGNNVVYSSSKGGSKIVLFRINGIAFSAVDHLSAAMQSRRQRKLVRSGGKQEPNESV